MCLTTLASRGGGGAAVIKTCMCPCSSPFILMSTPAVNYFASFYTNKGMSKVKTHIFYLLGNFIPHRKSSSAQTHTHTTSRAEDRRCTNIIRKAHVFSCLLNNTPPCACKPVQFILYTSSHLLFRFSTCLAWFCYTSLRVHRAILHQVTSSCMTQSNRSMYDQFLSQWQSLSFKNGALVA